MTHRYLKILSRTAERVLSTRGIRLPKKARSDVNSRMMMMTVASRPNGSRGFRHGRLCNNLQDAPFCLKNVVRPGQVYGFTSSAAPLAEISGREAESDIVDIVKYLEGDGDRRLGCTDDVAEICDPLGGLEQLDSEVDVEPAGIATQGDVSLGTGVTEQISGLRTVEPSGDRSRGYDEFDYSNEIPRLKLHADGKYRKVIDLIADPQALASAFENIKTKQGKSNIFHPKETIDWRWCEQATEELRAGTYTFRPVRRVNFPVLGQREEMRSICIVHSKDQIILEAFRGVLEKIYSPLFSPDAFNCKHTAFESVKYGWKGTSWFMNFVVGKSYDEANLKRLKSILREKIQDQRFLDTLTQMFNAGIIGLERFSIEEGGILSSMLCNIYFQKFDEEVGAVKGEWNTRAKNRVINPAYTRLMFIDKRTMVRLGGNAEQLRREKHHRLALARKLRISPIDYKDSHFTRVKYVRVGDDFLVGLSGSKGTALKILKRLTTFLQSNLHLQVDMEKTRLGHAISDKTLFMGAYIRVLDPKDLPEFSSALTRAISKKRAQTMRVKEQLEDRWTRECRNVVLKCWTVAFEKWRRDLGKDGAKRRTVEAAMQQLLSMPEEESLRWRERSQDLLQVFISSALRQGLFPTEEVDIYLKVLASLEQGLAKVPNRKYEDMED